MHRWIPARQTMATIIAGERRRIEMFIIWECPQFQSLERFRYPSRRRKYLSSNCYLKHHSALSSVLPYRSYRHAIQLTLPMFTKVLIANRGEIACRIIRTLDRMGIASVAVYSEADAHAAHVAAASEAVCVGAAAAAQSYLRADAILAAAQSTGADAIHPGYGFLSENVAFAEACTQSGITFIGPTPDQIRQFGLKHEARAIAQHA